MRFPRNEHQEGNTDQLSSSFLSFLERQEQHIARKERKKYELMKQLGVKNPNICAKSAHLASKKGHFMERMEQYQRKRELKVCA